MTDGEYAQLVAGLKAGNKAALVTVDEPLPQGVSHDNAVRTMAGADRYVIWGDRRHFQNGKLDQGAFTTCHILDKERAAHLIAAGALWSGDDADHPAP